MIDNVDQDEWTYSFISLDRIVSWRPTRVRGPGSLQPLPDQPGSV
jgi:hypothetical protein